MVSTAAPSRTMRPRRSSAFTANGRMVSSLPVCSGSRTGVAGSGLVIAPEYRRGRWNLEALTAADLAYLAWLTWFGLLAGSLQAPRQNPLLCVEPVLGLVEHHRLRAVDHVVGDLFAAMSRQAVHEEGVGLGARNKPGITLVRLGQFV